MKKRHQLSAGLLLALIAPLASAQVPNLATIKTDDQWRAAFGLGFSRAGGNTSASSLNLSADAARASSIDKWTLGGRYLRGRSDGVTNADQAVLGTRYDRDIVGQWFGFGQGNYLRDRLANLSGQYAGNAGVGYHLVRSDPLTWDLFAGVGYIYDSYVAPAVVAGELRDHYGRAEVLFGEESQHKLSDTTTFKQRLAFYPSLRESAGRRATFDASLVVAINKVFALNATLGYRYNSEPGLGLKTNDTLFVTSITYRIE